jgi:tagatose kinase
MKSILTIGEILVEIMATDKGDGFLEPVKLVGPIDRFRIQVPSPIA